MPSKVATNPANPSTKISPSADILASPTQTKNTNGHSTSWSRSKSIVPSVNPPLVAATTVSSSAGTSNNKSSTNATGCSVSRHLWKDQPTIGRYKLTRTLGRGNFAKVKLGEHLLTGQQVAIKVIDKTQLNDNSLKKMVREVRIMKMLNHPNIVRLYEVIESERRVYLVMEYASNGEVFDYLVLNGRMKEKEARVKFRQLISAVEYCHRKNIVHRDLKAENLLLDKDYNIKLADFGFSNFYDDSHKLDTYCGSPPYAAPELFQGQKYTGPEVDVWSLGVILYTLVSGTLPFDAPNLKELQSRVIRGKYRVPFYMSTECEQLLRKLLVLSPSKRKPLNTVMNDKWLNLGFDQSILEQYLEPPPDYHDPVRLSIMQKMGYPPDEVREALRNQTFNNLTAIYLLLGNRENSSALVSSMPAAAAAGDSLAPPGTSSSNATTTSLSETSTSAGGDEEENTSSGISGAASREGQQNPSCKSDTSSKPKVAVVVEQPARKGTGETSVATVGGGNVELKKPPTYSWMKHSSSAGPPPREDTAVLPVSDGPTLVLPRIHLPNNQWPVGKTGQSEQPPSSFEVHPNLTGADTCATGEEAKKSQTVGRTTIGGKLRQAGSDAATCLQGLSTSPNQPLSRAAQFSDIPNLVTTGSPSPKTGKDRSSTLEEEDEPHVDGASLEAGTTGDPASPQLTTPFITKPAVIYRKPNAIFSCHRRQEPRLTSFAQKSPDANAPIVAHIDSNSQQPVSTSEEKDALASQPGRHVLDILNPESRHQFTRNCPDRATMLGLTPARLRRRPQSKPRGEPPTSGGDNNSASSSTAAAATTSSSTQSQADTLYGSVTGGPNPTGSDGTLNSGIVPQLPRTDPPPAPTVASKLQWSMRFRSGKDVDPEEKHEQPLQAAGRVPLAKHNSSGDLAAGPTSPAQRTGGRFFRRLTMRLYRSVRRNRSCNCQHKSPTTQANDEQEAQPTVSEAQSETADVAEGVQALASDPWTAMLPGRLQLQCAMPTTFSVYKLSNSSGGSGSNRGSTGQERSDYRQAQPDVKTETGAHGTQPEKAISQGLTPTSSTSTSPSTKPQHCKVKPKRLPLVHRLPIVGRSPQILAEKVGTVLDSFKISHTVTPTSPFCFICSTTVTGKQLNELNQLSTCVGGGDDDVPDDDVGLVAKGDWKGRAPRHKSLSVDLVSAKSPRFLKWEMEIFQLMGPAPRYGIRFKRICGSREAYRILGQRIIQNFI